jgi:hypothetical protein
MYDGAIAHNCAIILGFNHSLLDKIWRNCGAIMAQFGAMMAQ